MKVRRIVIAGAAALAAAVGTVPPAVQAASASAPTWTHQAPAVSPPGRIAQAMAYDAATGTVVLFGGNNNSGALGDTWTWDGTTWTKRHPATSPSVRGGAAMAYDAATGTVVLFGGHDSRNKALGDTWTWDGTTWTERHPATSPPVRGEAAMAYDGATGTVVLFGGWGNLHNHAGTWTWDGTTWTKQHPAAHPPARDQSSMAYDAATGTVVLFGGFGAGRKFRVLGDTWTWDGKTWTNQHPAAHPPGIAQAAMAYDAATSTAMLFGGYSKSRSYRAGTWTWG